MRLYELADAWRALDAALEESGGEITPEIGAELERLEPEWTAKVDSISSLVAEAKAEAAAFKAEADRLTVHQRQAEKRADGWKAYLFQAMQATGQARIDGLRFRARIQRNPMSVRYTGDPANIPEHLRRVRIEPDLSAARDIAKSGEQLPNGFEVIQGSHLRIE